MYFPAQVSEVIRRKYYNILIELLPVVTMTLMPRCLDSSMAICDVWRASSLVGTTIMAWAVIIS